MAVDSAFWSKTNGVQQLSSGLLVHKGLLDASFLRANSQVTPNSGVGLELYYAPSGPYAVIQGYNRDTSQYTDLIITSKNISLLPQSGGKVTMPAGGWTSPTFQNGFASYTSPWGPVGYNKLATGLVKLRGLLVTPTPFTPSYQGGSGTVTTLPSGYRPAINLLFVCATQNGAQRLDVYPDGSITVTSEVKGGTAIGAGMWCSINEISFVADQ